MSLEVSALGQVSLLAEQEDTPGRDEGGIERSLCGKTQGKNIYINSRQLWLNWNNMFKQLQNSLFWAVALRRPGRTRKLCVREGWGSWCPQTQNTTAQWDIWASVRSDISLRSLIQQRRRPYYTDSFNP